MVEISNSLSSLRERLIGTVGSTKQVQPLITSIMRMTQQALRATASSLLLFDGQGHELYFMFANGQVGKQIGQLRVKTQTGIAGWVAQNGKPLIVNDVTKDRRFNRALDEVTGFVTKSIICAPLIRHQKVIGVIEVLNKLDGTGFNQHDLQTIMGVADTAALATETLKLKQSMLVSYKITLNALVSAVEATETHARGHSRRVMQYALAGAVSLPLSWQEKQAIEYAALLHDIGKLGIPDSILNKIDTLTKREWEMIRKHPAIGFNLLRGISFLKEARQLILYHHERFDGTGYPHGLKGTAIPMGARLIAVADAFDYMTTRHSYRVALSVKDALLDLRRCTHTQFCPAAIQAFCCGFVRFQIRDTVSTRKALQDKVATPSEAFAGDLF